jgi:hypothetical protein
MIARTKARRVERRASVVLYEGTDSLRVDVVDAVESGGVK